MPTLLIDMPSGVAGDMLLGALIGCGGDVERMRVGLLALGLGPIGVTAEQVQVGGHAVTPRQSRRRMSPSRRRVFTVPSGTSSSSPTSL